MTLELCPKCRGQKHVYEPPNHGGDYPYFTTASTMTFPCPTCDGKGYIDPEGGKKEEEDG